MNEEDIEMPDNGLLRRRPPHSSASNHSSTSSRPFTQHRNFQRLRHLLSRRTNLAWLLVGFVFAIFFLLRIPSSNTFGSNLTVVHYDDTTQLTDYDLLDRLLTDQQDPTQKQFNRYERTPDWVSNGEDPSSLTFSQQLARQLTKGHSFEQLEKLTLSIPSPDSVSATAIVHASVQHLQPQLKAVLSQTVLPTFIWVVCTADSKEAVEHAVSLLGSKRIQIIVRDGTGWIQLAQLASTEYTWLVSEDAVPGNKYFELLYKLALTPDYRFSLVGTEAAQVEPYGNHIKCLTSTQSVTKAVDLIYGTWLLHRSWVSYLIRVNDQFKLQSATDSAIGYFLSHALLHEAGISSIVLPTSPHQPEMKGNILQGTEDSVCRAIDKYLTTSPQQRLVWQRQPTGDTSTELPSVAFVIDGMEQLDIFMELICRFQQNKNAEVHVITTGEHRGLSNAQLQSKLQQTKDCSGVVSHDLSIRFGPEVGMPSDSTWSLGTEVMHGLGRQFSQIQPQIVLYAKQPERSIAKGVEVAVKLARTVAIALPARDIPYTLWMADLPLSSLESWHVISIKLIVTMSHEPQSLPRLVRSAAKAHFLGDKIDVTLAMEQTTDRAAQSFVNSFPWPHGDKVIRHRIVPVNAMPVFVESWYPTGDDEYAILLHDNLEVSPQFYVWAKYAVLRYRYANDLPKGSASMFGVSLYAPRVIETDPHERRLFNATAALSKGKYKHKSAYLMQIPSVSGALFFPEHWREFHDYITARLADQTTHNLLRVTVPNTRSSQWKHSWQRYLDELIYMRGYVMLYPNVDHGSFSTTHLDLDPLLLSYFPKAVQLFSIPLLADDTTQLMLPNWEALGVLDMWGTPQTMNTLEQRGLKLHRQVSACPPIPLEEHMYDPSDLLCPFARVVTVEVDGMKGKVADLPTRSITLYVAAPTYTGLSDDM